MKISSLQRIYIPSLIELGVIFEISDAHVHYLASVMRGKIGACLRIFNESCGEFVAKILAISKKSCTIEVIELLRKPEALPRLILAQSIIKSDRMMQALSMATQLGVTAIVPIITERVQTKTINHERSLRILIENTEQSERLSVPALHQPQSLVSFIQAGGFDKLIYANENEDSALVLRKPLMDNKMSILIGPEGGFTDAELELLHSCPNAHSVSLGTTVLRSETATAALCANIQLLRRNA